jgi:hypothetical protein
MIMGLGGKDAYETIRRMCIKLFTDDCTSKMNWRGKGGKVCFAKTKPVGIIISKDTLS